MQDDAVQQSDRYRRLIYAVTQLRTSNDALRANLRLAERRVARLERLAALLGDAATAPPSRSWIARVAAAVAAALKRALTFGGRLASW